jgi:diacylglycerol kinase family enzyme
MRAQAILLNPYANGGKGRSRWHDVLADARARELGLDQAQTYDRDPSGAAAWVLDQAQAGVRRFVAAGGDGTVHLALQALLAAQSATGEGLALGAVALGSSNDFHKPFGAPGRECIGGRPARVDFSRAAAYDVGRVHVDDGPSRSFLINASVGATAEANFLFNNPGPVLRVLKRTWVDGAIFWAALSTLARFRNLEARIEIEGEGPCDVRLSNLGVVKNPCFSGGFRYDVPQRPDDGWFGVHLCKDLGKTGLVRTLVALGMGRFQGLPGASSRQARAVDVQADRPFAVETDGEVIRTRHARFHLLPGEILVCP